MMREIMRWTAALVLVPVLAMAGNTGQNTVTTKDVSAVIAQTNTWQQLAKSDPQRAKMLCQNVGTTDLGFAILPMTNNNVAPVPAGIGSAGVFTMAAKVSYEPDGGWIDGGEIWIIGTATTSVMTCALSPSQP